MIDLIDNERKIIYRFTTNIQSAVEYFCISMIGYHYNTLGAIFSHPVDTGKNSEWKDYNVTIVKVKLINKHYQFQMGSDIQEELS